MNLQIRSNEHVFYNLLGESINSEWLSENRHQMDTIINLITFDSLLLNEWLLR